MSFSISRISTISLHLFSLPPCPFLSALFVLIRVASALGIHPIGWAITALPRLPQEQYGGAMVLSGAEVRQAARFQTRFTDAHTGRSPFFTLVFQMNAQQQVEPLAFQVR